ncbi:hypothetical protein [Hyalangium gracile]|uniref:hypothetical protein n=1 Tax=Hyalangium gracile TaxID=394092 RepID=UPI001CD03D3A|nr:hypothetical protein [Hyalangium gracile]
MQKTLRTRVLEGDLKGPSQKGFEPEQWLSALRAIPSPSLEDLRLFAAALWFDSQFEGLRAYFEATPVPPGRPDQIIRRAVGLVNRECLTVAETVQRNLAATRGTITQRDIVESRISLAGNVNVAPAEATVEGTVDGLRFELAALTASTPRTFANELDGLGQLRQMFLRLNFTIAYHGLEEDWMECLHHDLAVEMPEDQPTQLVPRDLERASARALGLDRETMLVQEMMQHGIEGLRKLPRVLDAILRRKAIRFRKLSGKVHVGETTEDMAVQIHLWRMVASEPDLDPHAKEPLESLGGVTLLEMLEAWAALVPLTMDIASRMPRIPLTHPAQFEELAPLIPVRALVAALAKATGLADERCRTIIDALTWRTVRDSLWFRPLVSVGPEHRVIVLAALQSPNLRRSLEYWMSEGGWDLGKRGTSYEDHVRASLAKKIKGKPHWNFSGVVPHKLQPPDSSVGDLDLVVWIGNKILVGEIKCFRRPATSHEWFLHEERIRDAVKQLQGKVKYVRENPAWLADEVNKVGGNVDPAAVSIECCVVLNSALGSLQIIDEVPIVDTYILNRYFNEGRGEILVSTEPVKTKTVAFYNSQDEAAEKLGDYLRQPPHLSFYKKLVTLDERRQLDFTKPGQWVSRRYAILRTISKSGGGAG